MNKIDWSKQGGYPLIQNTMNFHQSDYIRLMYGLARAMQLSNTSSVCILSGCAISFPAVGFVAISEGLISWTDGEPLYVQATPSPLPANVPLYFERVVISDPILDPTQMEDGMNSYNLHQNRYARVTTTAGVNTAPFEPQLSFSAMVRNESMPLASVINFAGNTPPANWLKCEGQTLNYLINTEYTALYNIIGTTYGAGSTGEFKLPDLRDRFARGANSNLGTTGGNAQVSLNVGNLPPHYHKIEESGDHGHSNNDQNQNDRIANDFLTGHNTGNTSTTFGFGPLAPTGLAGNHDHGGVTGSMGNGDPVNIINPYLALSYIIRVL